MSCKSSRNFLTHRFIKLRALRLLAIKTFIMTKLNDAKFLNFLHFKEFNLLINFKANNLLFIFAKKISPNVPIPINLISSILRKDL